MPNRSLRWNHLVSDCLLVWITRNERFSVVHILERFMVIRFRSQLNGDFFPFLKLHASIVEDGRFK